MNNLLVQVKRLKDYAKASKDFEDFEDAIKDLEKAIEILLPVYQRIDDDDNDYKITLSQEIADCYGMMGGIYRRRAKKDGDKAFLEKSAEIYKEGLKYEINASYNLSNSIVLQILVNSQSLEDLQGEIKHGIQTLQKQTKGKQRDQWWAWADLGLFYLLVGDLVSAQDAYAKFTQLGTPTQHQESVISVLEELRDALDADALPLARTVIDAINTTIRDLRRKELKAAAKKFEGLV